jgi:hypothetical protein
LAQTPSPLFSHCWFRPSGPDLDAERRRSVEEAESNGTRPGGKEPEVRRAGARPSPRARSRQTTMRQNSQYVEIGDKCNKASMRSLKGTHNVMERGHTTGLAKWLRRATERAQEGKSRRCGGQALDPLHALPPGRQPPQIQSHSVLRCQLPPPSSSSRQRPGGASHTRKYPIPQSLESFPTGDRRTI